MFSFTAGGGLNPTSFQLDDDGFANNGISNTRQFTGVPAGSGYSVAQDAPTPAGYDPPQASCSDGSEPVEHRSRGVGDRHLHVRQPAVERGHDHDRQGRAAGRPVRTFAFSPHRPDASRAGRIPPPGRRLAAGNSASFVVNPGSGYILSESLGGAVGSAVGHMLGRLRGDVDHHRSERGRHLHVRQLKPGTIRVKKDAHPRDPQDFSFTAGGGLSPSNFSLDYDSDSTLSSERAFSVTPGPVIRSRRTRHSRPTGCSRLRRAATALQSRTSMCRQERSSSACSPTKRPTPERSLFERTLSPIARRVSCSTRPSRTSPAGSSTWSTMARARSTRSR